MFYGNMHRSQLAKITVEFREESMGADFRVTRDEGSEVRIEVLVPWDDRDVDYVTVEVDLHVADIGYGVRVHTYAECANHRFGGGGICNACGGRGSSTEVPEVKIRGFEIVNGDLASPSFDNRLNGLLKIQFNGSVPLGRCVSDARSVASESVYPYVKFMGDMFNIVFFRGGLMIVFPDTRPSIIAF